MNTTTPIRDLIALYLDSRKRSWSASTLRSESYRLTALADSIDGTPEKLWEALAHLKPYARVTAFTRVSAFYDWAIARGHIAGPNRYALYRDENQRDFKQQYVYKRKELPEALTFEEAKRRLSLLPADIQAKALRILSRGLRYSEEETLKRGKVMGKGHKERDVFLDAPEGPVFDKSYQTFWRALKSVGLRPHDLRALAATRFAEAGLSEIELMKLMGWARLETAKYYVQARSRATVRELLNRAAQGESIHGTEKPLRKRLRKVS